MSYSLATIMNRTSALHCLDGWRAAIRFRNAQVKPWQWKLDADNSNAIRLTTRLTPDHDSSTVVLNADAAMELSRALRSAARASRKAQDKMTFIPSAVLGMTVSDARKLLEALGLIVSVRENCDNSLLPAGSEADAIVTSVDPAAETFLARASRVTLHIESHSR